MQEKWTRKPNEILFEYKNVWYYGNEDPRSILKR